MAPNASNLRRQLRISGSKSGSFCQARGPKCSRHERITDVGASARVSFWSNPVWISQTIDLKQDSMKISFCIHALCFALILSSLQAGTEVNEKTAVASDQTT